MMIARTARKYMLLLLIAAALMVVSGCSTEHFATNGGGAPVNLPEEAYEYPPLTPEQFATGPAPGYQFVQFRRPGTLDERRCMQEQLRDWEGGSVVLRDNGVTISDAAMPVEHLRVRVCIPHAEYGVMDLSPHPLQFNAPVLVQISLEGVVLPMGADLADLTLWYVPDDGSGWQLVDGWVDVENRIIFGWTDHFSRYIIGAPEDF